MDSAQVNKPVLPAFSRVCDRGVYTCDHGTTSRRI